MTNTQQMPCPNCNSVIEFNVRMLLQGSSFSCSNCNAKISLSSEGKEQAVESMNAFNELKSQGLHEK